ncbi:unnamed protein product [Ectocarpus sp. 13 AM-2016]
MTASNKSTKAKQEKGEAYATAAAARGQDPHHPSAGRAPGTPFGDKVCAEWTALDCPHRPGAQADADGVCAGVRRYGHITPSVEQDPVGNVPDGEGFPCRPAQGSLRGTAEDRLSRPVLLSTAGLDIDWH